ncbi:MAG: glycosyltransferase [Candidatus Kerfeldbacteria bacterium]|nr:glycosyltransferase [Candidatus Kerfeldbacteria bacterium]
MKVAIVHDHLAQNGGAEQVLKVFCEIWPDAPVYVVVHDPKNADPFFNDKDIRTSFIQRLPFGLRKYQWFFPLMPTAVESYDLSEYDVVISTSSSFAKGIVTRPDTVHVAYCHTPTRFLWSDTHSYVQEIGVPKMLQRPLQLFLSRVRIWDRLASERADVIIANSAVVQHRIKKYYHRNAQIIHPPVTVSDFFPVPLDQVGNYFFAGGRLVPYKRFDLLVTAFNKLGRPLKIFGTGPELQRLKKMAHPNIEFLGRISESELKKHYAHCQAFLNPQEEDFGITMIEALASGRPVIAYNKGGAAEIVQHGVNGLLIQYQTWEDFANAILDFDAQQFEPETVRATVERFDVVQFKKKIQQTVDEAVASAA